MTEPTRAPSGVPDLPTASGRRWDASRIDCGFSVIREGVAIAGFHVNLLEPSGGAPQAWSPYRLFPFTPERVFAGMEDRMVFLKFTDETAAEAVLGEYLAP